MKFIKSLLGLVLLAVGLPALAAQQLIPTATGSGIPAQQGFAIVNSNFKDLYSFLYAPITGPVTVAPGTNTSVIGNSVLTNGMHALMPASTFKCNALTIAATPQDCTVAQVQTLIGTGGGSGGLTSFTVSVPGNIMNIAGSPGPVTINAATPGFTINMNSQNANTVYAAPAGSNGVPGFRALAGSDLPNYTGQVTSVAGVTTIAPGVVSNAMLATVPANTIKCNSTAASGPPADCTITTINTMIGNTGGGGGTGLSNQVDGCSFPGIDSTGATDSGAGLVGAFAAVAGTNKELVINCPIKIVIGTNAAAPIFIHDSTNVTMGPSGRFIVDNTLIAAFVCSSCQNITWKDVKFTYVGQLPINNAVAPYVGVVGAFNDGPMKSYMSTFLGNTFSGSGSELFTSPTNACAILRIVGAANHLNFYNTRFRAALGANAANFIPVAVEIAPNWTPGQLVTNNNQAQTTANVSFPQDVNFINPIIDGAYMGFLGGGNINIVNPLFLRYSDLQDSAGNNMGGVNTWFAPPHAIYLQQGDVSFGNHVHITQGYDAGQWVGPVNRRTAASGWAVSLKTDVANGGVVDGWTSLRPDGCVDFLNNQSSPQGGVFRNIVCIGNSATSDGAGSAWPIFRMPSAACYQNINIENLTIIDLNPSPPLFPVNASTNACNNNISVTGLKIFLNDWPATNTGWPATSLGGNGWNWQEELYFNQYSATQSSRGVIGVQGSSTCTNCNLDVKVTGWMLRPVAFSAAITVGMTTLPPLASSWGFTTGTYTVTFPTTQEVRSVLLTNGSTTVGPVTAMTSAEAATGAVASGQVALAWANYKQRLLVNYAGGSVGTHAHVLDTTNAYEIVADTGVETDVWTQSWNGSPVGTTAAGQATTISFPNVFAIDRNSAYVWSGLAAGPTSFNVGWVGNNTALRSGVGVTTGTNPSGPIGTAVILPNNPTQVVLYPVGANFGSGGNTMISARGSVMLGAQ